ncbi:glycerol-3-phosphate 1-O-acyltransferase PlsY [Legionella fallonii]|uniref:Glycerol-3-phosphate acyltransferase n=1 Tax=Legionella fallonii LLAP-10 TaxID=1212491 RepID=A0A098G9F2_9GAMM|nr:glycerol-3-phosphate 1-O-acyltransferase PlsY [Legionella fallonii]CEG58591.1 Glycerol-3-phosphate acyltransferase [Legionella fallonii LLAP-10]
MVLSLFLVALGYLMGSFCSAVIVCRLFGLPDPREEGSKNPGATNVLRLAGKQYAALVMLADLLKGTIPVLIAKVFEADAVTVSFTALAAVVGHMYPVFFEFKGGKGVATAIGALLGFYFIIGVMVAITWLLIAKFSRYSSLASITAIGLSPFYTLLLIGRQDILPPLFIMVILILFKHRNNITRLIDGVEPKIKLKSNVMERVIEPELHTMHTETEKSTIEEQLPLLKEETPVKAIQSQQPKTKKIAKTKEPIKKSQAVKPKTKNTDQTVKSVKKPVKKTVKKATPNKTKINKTKET